jgi:hypothetical protein
MTMLACPECRRENEPERIYCHDCGARLDRSSLAKAVSKEEAPEVTHRRVKALFDARGAKLRSRFFKGSKFILAALALAGVVQMIRPPDVPEVPKAEMLSRQISLELENAASSATTAPMRFTEQEVNSFLGYSLKSKKVALSKWLNFERAIVALQEGYANITVERSLLGFSMFTSASYAIAQQNGNVIATSRGGMLGRLPVHPMLMKYAGRVLFGDLLGVLDRDRKSLAKLGSIELHPQLAVVNPRGQ